MTSSPRSLYKVEEKDEPDITTLPQGRLYINRWRAQEKNTVRNTQKLFGSNNYRFAVEFPSNLSASYLCCNPNIDKVG